MLKPHHALYFSAFTEEKSHAFSKFKCIGERNFDGHYAFNYNWKLKKFVK